MKSLAMHSTNQKLSFDILMEGNLQNISSWNMIFGLAPAQSLSLNKLKEISFKILHRIHPAKLYIKKKLYIYIYIYIYIYTYIFD